MQLLTDALKAVLPPLYANEGYHADPLVVAKFAVRFAPGDIGKAEERKDKPCPGATGTKEFGYTALSQLEEIRLPFGLAIERDLHFTPCPLSEARAKERI